MRWNGHLIKAKVVETTQTDDKDDEAARKAIAQLLGVKP